MNCPYGIGTSFLVGAGFKRAPIHRNDYFLWPFAIRCS